MTVLDYAKDVFVRPELYRKFWVAVGGALLTATSTLIPDSPYLAIIIQFMTAIGVLGVSNVKSK